MVTKTLLQSICASILAASKDETRYHLNHVRLEPTDNSLVIVATNGHWLSHITLSKGHAGDLYQLTSPLHFPPDAIKRLQSELKLIPRYQESIDLDLRKYSIQEDINYPNWRQFIQNKATPVHTPTIGLSGEYLADITKFFKQLGVKRPPLKLNIIDKLSPVTITVNTQSLPLEAQVILMPIRV